MSTTDPSYWIYASNPLLNPTSKPAPITYTFTASDAGVHTFFAILGMANDQNANIASALNISISDGTYSAKSNPFNIIAGTTVTQVVVSPTVTNVVAGSTVPFTVKAEDSYGNLVANSHGIQFTLTDPSDTGAMFSTNGKNWSSFPATFTFNNTGSMNLSALFTKATTQQIVATDATAGVTGISPAITVTAGAASQLVYLTDPSATGVASTTGNLQPNIAAGTPIMFVVVAEDKYGNYTSNYGATASLSLSTNDPKSTFYANSSTNSPTPAAARFSANRQLSLQG